MTAEGFRPCIIVPVYNHEVALGMIIARLQATGLPVILIDDGSDESCATSLVALTKQYVGISLIVLPENLGKGGAVKAGLFEAFRQGFSHAIQVDADGQHDIADVARFVAVGRANASALICGYPVYDESVPRVRLYARYLTHVWVWINTLSLTVKDSMCGFRVYPLARTTQLLTAERTGNRMDFDTEVMVRWVWRGWPVIGMDTKVAYPLDGVSHFALWRDNVLISCMHTRLFFGMLARLPIFLMRRLGCRAG